MRDSRLVLLIAALALAACRGDESAPVPGSSNQSETPAGNVADSTPATAERVGPEGVDPASAAPATAAPAPRPASSPASGTVQSPISPTGYRLIGTEPFWGGTVTATEIVYSTPDNQQGERIAVTAAYGADREVYTGSFEGRPFVLTLTSGPCSDGMSDNVHSYTARLQVGGESRQGCANPQRG